MHITGAPTPEEIKAFNLISQLYRECIRRQITLINVSVLSSPPSLC